jgi:tetratricopeptide (TPR) repeat protein
MIRKFFIFVFLLGVGAVLVLNHKSILALGQERIVAQQAEGAISVKNWEKAIGLYEGARQMHPGNQQIALRLAWLKLMEHKPAEAEAIYREILKDDPSQLEAAMGLAALLDSDPKHINQAVLLLRHALKEHPNNPRLITETGNLYKIAAENPQETRAETRKWLYDLAIYYYQASLKLNPRQFQTQFNLGVSNQAIDQPQLAAEAYCQAVSLNPGSYEARYNLGLVLSALNFQAEAYRQMDAAVKLLGEADMESAQGLAIKVQNVKNNVFNSGDKGLSSHENPSFLDKKCLVQTASEAGKN